MSARRRVTAVTGSRADFSLLAPVMRAIAAHEALALDVVVTGTHLLPPARTVSEVEAVFPVAARIPMQQPGPATRLADAAALGRGISGLAAHLASSPPDVVLVLGDRIEAFAAAATAAVAGIRAAHLHGGDRAEGIADEAMRHAITKLAHIHLVATSASAARVVAMGEEPARTHVVGSPAIDGLADAPPLDDRAFALLGEPEILVLMHPEGAGDDVEAARAARLLRLCRRRGRVLALHPNHDPGRDGIVRAIGEAGVVHRPHLSRASFIGLLRRCRMIAGNSSAGLIECAAIPLRCVDVGARQAGREKPDHVVSCSSWDEADLAAALDRAARPIEPFHHPYGDGRTGPRVASLLASFDPSAHPLRKRNTY
jgi:UDP-hydrolysing UDP-N-acetyl-D-glucosamine 2-epimerase